MTEAATSAAALLVDLATGFDDARKRLQELGRHLIPLEQTFRYGAANEETRFEPTVLRVEIARDPIVELVNEVGELKPADPLGSPIRKARIQIPKRFVELPRVGLVSKLTQLLLLPFRQFIGRDDVSSDRLRVVWLQCPAEDGRSSRGAPAASSANREARPSPRARSERARRRSDR